MCCKVICTLALIVLVVNIVSGSKRFRDVVKNSPCNERSCQLQPGGVINCCFLKPLNDLNEIVDVRSVTIPRSLRLHIMFANNEKALCTDIFHPTPDITNKKNMGAMKKCSGAFKLKSIKNGLFEVLTGLTIKQTQLEYISENVFSLFPQLKHLVIEENLKLSEIPKVNSHQKKMLQSIQYIDNREVTSVKWNEDSNLPSLREFIFTNFKTRASDNPAQSFNMGVFTPGKNFNNFIMRLNYQEVNIKMPNVKKENSIESVFIGTSNIPENLHVDFNKTHGKIQKLLYNLPVKPERIFPNLLPDNFYGMFESVDINFDNENYKLKSLAFHNSIPTQRVIKVSRKVDENELTELSYQLGRPKQGKKSDTKVNLQYIILTTDELQRVLKDPQKQYTIKTHFLWVRNVNYLRKSFKINLRYNFLILSKKCALFSADVQSAVGGRRTVNKDYQNTFSTSELWESFDLKQIYEFLTTAVIIARKVSDTEEEASTRVKSIRIQLVSTMLNSVKEKKVLMIARYMSPAPTKMQYHYVEDALHKTHKLVAFSAISASQTKPVVDFNARTYQKKTVLLQNIIKTLITSERYQKNDKLLLSGNKLLFDIAQTRIDVLKNIAKEESERSIQDEKSFRETFLRIRTLRLKYENDLHNVKKRFYDIVKREKKVEIFEHLVDALNAITNVFSDKMHAEEPLFPLKTGNSYKSDLLHDLKRSLSAIYSVTNKIKDLQSLILKKFVQVTPRKYEVLEHKDPEKHTFTYFDMRKKQVSYKEGFSCDDAIMIMNKLYEINVQDMLQWDMVMKQLDKLLDTSISKEIPETLAFKTTLLRLMDIGKVETQAMYDVAKVQAEIFLGNYTDDVYSLQLSQISKVLKKTTEDIESGEWTSANADLDDEFTTTRTLSITQLKLDVFLHLQDYCSWVEYNSLQECTLAQEFNFDASLSTLLYLTNELLVASALPTSLEPTSQTFIDLPIRYKFGQQCEEVIKVVNNAYTNVMKSNKKKTKKKKTNKEEKRKQNKKMHLHKKEYSPTKSTTNSFTPMIISPPIQPWPSSFTGNYPIVFDPFNTTGENDDGTGITYKKTRVEPNITIVDTPNLMLQAPEDDFMQVAEQTKVSKINNTNSVSAKDENLEKHQLKAKLAHKRTENIFQNKTEAVAVVHSNSKTQVKKMEEIQPSVMKSNGTVDNNNNTAGQNDVTVHNQITEEINMQRNATNFSNITSPANVSSDTPFPLTSSAVTPINPHARTSTIADVAENIYDGKEVQTQVLADWIGEKIIENEIRKHKAAQQNSEKRSKAIGRPEGVDTTTFNDDMMGENTRSIERENTFAGMSNDTTNKLVMKSSIKNNDQQNQLKQEPKAMFTNSNKQIFDFQQNRGVVYQENITTAHHKRKRRKKHKINKYLKGVKQGGVQGGIRVRRSNYEDNYLANIFNNDLSLYMVTNGIDTREQFETIFRKCNASKVVEMKKNNFATVSLSLFNNPFRPFDRVRIEEVKVFLHGAKTATGFIEVKIESGSILQNRLNKKKFTFLAKKWDRVFRYKIPKNSESSSSVYEMKADNHNNRSPLALLPTPFTTWIISVSSDHNPGLDLSALTSIEILFTGSFLVNTKRDNKKELPDFFQRIKKEKQQYLNEQNKKMQKDKNKSIHRKDFVAKEKKNEMKKTNRRTPSTVSWYG